MKPGPPTLIWWHIWVYASLGLSTKHSYRPIIIWYHMMNSSQRQYNLILTVLSECAHDLVRPDFTRLCPALATCWSWLIFLRPTKQLGLTPTQFRLRQYPSIIYIYMILCVRTIFHRNRDSEGREWAWKWKEGETFQSSPQIWWLYISPLSHHQPSIFSVFNALKFPKLKQRIGLWSPASNPWPGISNLQGSGTIRGWQPVTDCSARAPFGWG